MLEPWSWIPKHLELWEISIACLSHSVYCCCCCLVARLCLTLCDPMDTSPPGSSAMRFPRQGYWIRFPFPSPRNLPNPTSNVHLLHCRQILYHWATMEVPIQTIMSCNSPNWLRHYESVGVTVSSNFCLHRINSQLICKHFWSSL